MGLNSCSVMGSNSHPIPIAVNIQLIEIERPLRWLVGKFSSSNTYHQMAKIS